MKKTWFTLTLLLIFMPVLSADTTLSWNSSFTQGWTVSPDALMLSEGAGSDYTEVILSPEYTEALTVESDGSWSLYIESEVLLWHEGVTLSVRAMAPDPESFDVLQETFVPLTSAPRRIASGTGDRELIGVQYRLEGVSVSQFKQSSWNTEIFLSLVEE